MQGPAFTAASTLRFLRRARITRSACCSVRRVRRRRLGSDGFDRREKVVAQSNDAGCAIGSAIPPEMTAVLLALAQMPGSCAAAIILQWNDQSLL